MCREDGGVGKGVVWLGGCYERWKGVGIMLERVCGEDGCLGRMGVLRGVCDEKESAGGDE